MNDSDLDIGRYLYRWYDDQERLVQARIFAHQVIPELSGNNMIMYQLKYYRSIHDSYPVLTFVSKQDIEKYWSTTPKDARLLWAEKQLQRLTDFIHATQLMQDSTQCPDYM
jgi:hypothetical protein